MGIQLQSNRFLREFSTFGIGGAIHLFAEVRTIQEMQDAFSYATNEKIPVLLIGKGSNTLFDDRGFSGLAILNKIDFCSWQDEQVSVGAGYSFSLLGVQSARRGLSGLEFASGIPASVGGAIFMNAGANRKETFDSVLSVLYLHRDGTPKEYQKSDLEWGYRSSSFQKMEGAIISATFDLKPHEEARKNQLAIVDYRMKSQPLKDKSIGCIFRNPSPNTPAGALIDRCGLKGFAVGGAKISEIHANFIVNSHNATASDVIALIEAIQQSVYDQTGIHLEPEIRIQSYA